MTARPIISRMTDAKAKVAKWRRTPKAFYLAPADHAEFMATGPDQVTALFRGKPRQEPGFEGLPVRLSDSAAARPSKLYCTAGTGFEVAAE